LIPKNIPIWAVKRFIKTWRNLSGSQKQRIGEILIALPDLMLNPHLHTGYGLRQLHGTHFHEVRLDLRWRFIFKVSVEEIFTDILFRHGLSETWSAWAKGLGLMESFYET
jgi:hypothetical protein